MVQAVQSRHSFGSSENSSMLKIAPGGHGYQIVVGNEGLVCHNHNSLCLSKLQMIIVVQNESK